MFKPQAAPRPAGRVVARIPLEAIRPNPAQPRRTPAPESIAALADSIRRHGQLSPLLVRRMPSEGYELIAGQRRLMALRALNRPFADAIVLTAGDCDCQLIALVENLQREALHFLDEAEAMRGILDACPITQERLAASLSISPSALNNRLRLLKLPAPVREAVRSAGLSERHARALLRLDDAQSQLALIRQAAEGHWTASQTEASIARTLRPKPPRQTVSRSVRDNRIIINAVMDTVRQLKRIGVKLQSRVDEAPDHIDVVVTIPVGDQGTGNRQRATGENGQGGSISC